MRSSLVMLGSVMVLIASLGAGCAQDGRAPAASTPDAYAPPTASSTVSTPAMSPDLSFPGQRPAAELQKKVRISTTKGDIVVQIDPQAGPNAASNFVYLVQQDFYRGTIFHRVIPGFMIQGGDPTGTGRSGPGYNIPDDAVRGLPQKNFQPFGVRPYYPKGTLAMARTSEPNSAGSQFFLMVADYPLDPDYAVFGKIISGQEVADAIAAVPRDEADRPLEDVKMTSVTIEP